jgi:sensor histidine kinase YesM
MDVGMLRHWMINGLKLAGFAFGVTAVCLTVMSFLHVVFPSDGASYVVIFFTHTLTISSLCWLAMPQLGAWTANFPFTLRWLILVSALMGMAVAGTVGASMVIHYSSVYPKGVPFLEFFGIALGTSIPVTIVVGVITTVIVASRDRLELSQAALDEQRITRETAEKLAAEAKLASLSSRVQPHFLFNSLNSIAALIRENPDEAEQTVNRLSSLLRSSLESAGTVDLAEELKLVRDYLEIQKTRMGERLTFEIAVDPGVRAAIPPFSVQTLVENSLKHVGEQREKGLTLQVRAWQQDSDVIVSVSDNGPGFDSRFVRAGHGLDNLQARLRAIYGDRAGLEFFREPDRMTVRLRIPRDESVPG